MTEICTNQVAYHLMFRAIEHSVLPLCIARNIPVMCYSSLMHGLLTGKFKTLSDFPRNRARTRIFDSRKNDLCRHGENGHESKAELALSRLRDLSGQLNNSHGVNLLSDGSRRRKELVVFLLERGNLQQSLGLKKYMDISLDKDVVTAISNATEKLKNQMGGQH